MASYYFRFICRIRLKTECKATSSSVASSLTVLQSLLCHYTPTSEEISASEIENTRICLSYLVQSAYFKLELQQLNRTGKLSTKSPLLLLNPTIQNHLLSVRSSGTLFSKKMLSIHLFYLLIVTLQLY